VNNLLESLLADSFLPREIAFCQVTALQRCRNGALHWIRELKIDPTSFSQVKIKARYTRKSDNVFNSTPFAILSAKIRLRNNFCLLPLGILVMRECKIENIFPHLSMRLSKEQLSQAWNIKSSTKT
jgi:hypothetical protein